MEKRSIIVNGYAYPNISAELLSQSLPNLTFISAFSYGIRSDGSLILLDDSRIRQAAQQSDVQTLMVLSSLTEEGDFDSLILGRALYNVQKREELISEILENLKAKKMYGVDFDFEYIAPQEKDIYIDLIRRAARRLNAEGYLVSVALAAKTSADQAGLLYEGHDYAAVGQSANLVLLMTYEWGYAGSEPMAVAPIPQIRQVLDYGVTEIPPEKILMGIPNYGYDWILPHIPGVSRARSIGNEEAVWLAEHYGAEIQYDETAQSPYFFFWDNQGRQHEVWFENERSIRAKLQLIDDYGLAGVSYWNLMRPFRANWQVLQDMFDVTKLPPPGTV